MVDVSPEGVTLHVTDLERSLAFYLKIPGAVLVHQRPGRFALLRIGLGRLSLLQMGKPGFHVEIGTSNLDALSAQLQQEGIEKSGPQPEQWGELGFIIKDPDGFSIEFDDHLHEE